MSFSDVGKTPVGGRRSSSSTTATGGTTSKASQSLFGPPPATIPEESSVITSTTTSSAMTSLNQVSDGILQYQRNLGILERIANQVGTNTDGPVLEQQYKVQVDVLKQLGRKLEQELQRYEQEQLLQQQQRNSSTADGSNSSNKTSMAKQRTTLLKLTRDYRKVHANFQTIQLETRRKRAKLQQQRQQQQAAAAAAQQQQQADGGGRQQHDDANLLLQQELQQQDRLHQEIMKEREEEILTINRGMHQVNEIYKDLAHIVTSQQEQVDSIETQMEESKVNAERGLEHVTKANEKASSTQCIIS